MCRTRVLCRVIDCQSTVRGRVASATIICFRSRSVISAHRVGRIRSVGLRSRLLALLVSLATMTVAGDFFSTLPETARAMRSAETPYSADRARVRVGTLATIACAWRRVGALSTRRACSKCGSASGDARGSARDRDTR